LTIFSIFYPLLFLFFFFFSSFIYTIFSYKKSLFFLSHPYSLSIISQNYAKVNHGTTRKLHCLWCQYEELVNEEKHLSEKPFPQCPKCNNPLKPEVILFGEYLPQDVYTAAIDISRKCDLLIAVGTSLEVYPASYIFFENKKATRVLFNYTAISNMNMIQYFVQGNVQHTLPELEKELRKIE